MHNKSYVFAQLASFLNRSKFNRIVAKYHGDNYIKHFSCRNQLKVLMFGQLSRRDSLRDLIVAVEAHRGKAKFLGFGDSVTRSNLAKTNQNRDYHIFEEFAYYMVEQAPTLRVTKIFNLVGNIYAFDSTTIELCLAVFCWVKFRKKKGGIKVHTLYDIEARVPAFFHITTASVHDSQVMKEIPVETGAYYIFDREYNFFLQLRRVEYYDEELEKNFVFIEPQVSGTVLQVVETTSEDQEVLGRLVRSSEYRLPIRRHFKTSLTNLTSVLTKNLTGSMNPLCLIFYFY